VRNNIPLELAFTMSDEYRAAFAINFSQFEGGEFDWDRWEFKRDGTPR
jgi:hypothetical protein